MNSKKKTRTANGSLPSLYAQMLVKSEYDYRREIRRKLEKLQHDNQDSIRRRHANDHVFARGLLNKRYQWFNADKSYRDACRTTWSRLGTESRRSSHIFLPSIYTPEATSSLTMASLTSVNTTDEDDEENAALTDERIKQDFLRVQPVLLEITRAPHASKALKYKREIELRKQSAEKRHVLIQKTAKNDNRYTELVESLHDL